MAYGARFLDASGNINSDISTSLCRKLGTVTTGTSNGSVSHAGFADGEGWYVVLPLSGTVVTTLMPSISIVGTTLSWTFPSLPSAVNSLIIYGVR